MKKTSWQRGLEAFLNGMILIGDILLVLVQNSIVAFGTLVVLGLLLVVEVHAVKLGLMTFEPDEWFATLGAVLLVILSLSVKFQEVYADFLAHDQRTRYQIAKSIAPSLRLTVRGWMYWLGIGRNWTERELPASHAFSATRRYVTWAILALAIVGRLNEAIQTISVGADGVSIGWLDGLQRLVTESSLSEMTPWIAALVFTWAAVKSSQQLTGYVAVRVIEIRRGLVGRQNVSIERPSAASIASSEVPRLRPVSMSALSAVDGHRTDTGQGYGKQMDARTIIRTHLDSHPEDAALTVRELAAKLNVGKSTVSEVLREVRTQEPAVYSNGNGRHGRTK